MSSTQTPEQILTSVQISILELRDILNNPEQRLQAQRAGWDMDAIERMLDDYEQHH